MLTVYYSSLFFARTNVYHQRQKIISNHQELKLYRNSGIFLLIMNFALGISTLLMVFSQKSFKYSGVFLYGVSIYATFKILFAIINISKTRGTNNYLEISYRSLNLVDGGFSLFALQTALVNQFFYEQNGFSVANLLTGSFFILFALSLGIFMIVKSKKEMNKT